MGLDLRKLLVDNNFKYDKKLAYGVYRERVISFLEKSSSMIVTINFSNQLSRENGQKISAKMSELKEKHRALQNALTTNLSIELKLYKSADIYMEVVEILDDVLNVLDQYHPSHIECCPLCGQVMPSNSPFVRVRDSVIQAHGTCIDQMVAASNQMGNELLFKFDKKSFYKSFLIAILCMIGTIGIVCLASFYKLFGIVSVLSGWGLLIVYRMILGRVRIPWKKHQLVLITIVSLITLIASLYLGSVIEIYKLIEELTLGEVFAKYIEILIKNIDGYTKPLIIDAALGLLFLGSTLFIYYRQMHMSKNLIKKL